MPDEGGTRKGGGEGQPASQSADAAVAAASSAGANAAANQHAVEADLAHRKTLPVGANHTGAGIAGERAGATAAAAAQESVRPLVSTRIDTQNAAEPEPARGERSRQATRTPNEPAFADTHRDVRQQDHRTARAARNAKLGRTLRMELKLGALSSAPEPEPRVPNQPELGRSQSRLGRSDAADPRDGQSLQRGLTRRVGGSAPAEYSSARSVLTTTTPMAPQTATFEPRDPFVRDPFAKSEPRNNVSRSESTRTTERNLLSQAALGMRRKAQRVGDRTMILSQKPSHLKDWLFVVALVAALGVTASMLFSYQSETAELREQVEEEEAASPFQPEQPPAAATATNNKPVAAPAPVRATELRSQPAGAEVAVQGAVVGNTPVRVARSDHDIDYTLRFPGYEPQVVRVGAQSPPAIAVTLRQSSAAPRR